MVGFISLLTPLYVWCGMWINSSPSSTCVARPVLQQGDTHDGRGLAFMGNNLVETCVHHMIRSCKTRSPKSSWLFSYDFVGFEWFHFHRGGRAWNGPNPRLVSAQMQVSAAAGCKQKLGREGGTKLNERWSQKQHLESVMCGYKLIVLIRVQQAVSL
jgi:hypothetical protein